MLMAFMLVAFMIMSFVRMLGRGLLGRRVLYFNRTVCRGFCGGQGIAFGKILAGCLITRTRDAFSEPATQFASLKNTRLNREGQTRTGHCVEIVCREDLFRRSDQRYLHAHLPPQRSSRRQNHQPRLLRIAPLRPQWIIQIRIRPN